MGNVDGVLSNIEVLIPLVLDQPKRKILFSEAVEARHVEVKLAGSHTHVGDSVDHVKVGLDWKFILVELLLSYMKEVLPFETLNRYVVPSAGNSLSLPTMERNTGINWK